MVRLAKGLGRDERPRYLEALAPIVFPEEGGVPESELHFLCRTILYQLLKDALGPAVTVGSDQFLYFDAGDPKQCLAPDAYVRLVPPGEPIRSWKVWERGAPEIAIEIKSESDAVPVVWEEKLRRYQRAGVSELVHFDAQAEPGAQLRIWDRVEGALTERAIESTRAPSLLLDLVWVIAPADALPLALRIATPSSAEHLFPTRAEALRAEAEARRAEAEARRAETEARMAAEARVRELEEELRQRSRT